MKGCQELGHVAVYATAGGEGCEFPVYYPEGWGSFSSPVGWWGDEDRTGVEIADGEAGFVLVWGAVEVFVDSGVESF